MTPLQYIRDHRIFRRLACFSIGVALLVGIAATGHAQTLTMSYDRTTVVEDDVEEQLVTVTAKIVGSISGLTELTLDAVVKGTDNAEAGDFTHIAADTIAFECSNYPCTNPTTQ